jgi:hypothetical protein
MNKENPKPLISVRLSPLDLPSAAIPGGKGGKNTYSSPTGDIYMAHSTDILPLALRVQKREISTSHITCLVAAGVQKVPPVPPENPKNGGGSAVPTAENPKKSVASVANPLSPEDLAEARRIAAELVKLHHDGVIKTKGDASFCANLIRDFDATYPGRHAASRRSRQGRMCRPPGSASRNHPTAFHRKREASSIRRTWATHSARSLSITITSLPLLPVG